MQQVAQVEREKEEYKVQLQSARKELDNAASQQTRFENKISKLQQIVRNANEEKSNVESKLGQKQLALQGVEDALKLKTDELCTLIDKHKSLELQFSSMSEQKSQTEVSLEKSFDSIFYSYFINCHANISIRIDWKSSGKMKPN